MKFVILFTLVIVVGCAPNPTLEELEKEASITGDWTEVEWREERIKKRLRDVASDCPYVASNNCIEERSGLQCYCVPSTNERHFGKKEPDYEEPRQTEQVDGAEVEELD